MFFHGPIHGYASIDWAARTYIYQLFVDTGCSQEDQAGAMDDRDGWGERVRKLCAIKLIWWWWLLPLSNIVAEASSR